MMDGEFLDSNDGLQGLQQADVMSILPALKKSIVIDTRPNKNDGPMINLLPMVWPSEERLHSLGLLRPYFPKVHELTIVEWARYVDSLVTLGVWIVLMKGTKQRQFLYVAGS